MNLDITPAERAAQDQHYTATRASVQQIVAELARMLRTQDDVEVQFELHAQMEDIDLSAAKGFLMVALMELAKKEQV